jgi:hypothetical protein
MDCVPMMSFALRNRRQNLKIMRATLPRFAAHRTGEEAVGNFANLFLRPLGSNDLFLEMLLALLNKTNIATFSSLTVIF